MGNDANKTIQELQKKIKSLQEKCNFYEEQISNLSKNQNEFKLMVENAGEGIIVVQDYKIKYANRKIAELLDYTIEEIKSLPMEKFVYEKDRKRVFTNLKNRLEGLPAEDEYDFRIVKKNGEIKWFHIRPVIIEWEGKRAILDFLVDVTERKILEEKLANSLSILNATLESIKDAILVVNTKREVLYYNSSFLKMWGLKESDVKNKTSYELIEIVKNKLVNPEEFVRLVEEYYSEPERIINDVLKFKNGKIFERNSFPYKVNGNIVGRVWYSRDITRQKENERKLLESEKKYRELVESVNSIVLRWKSDGTITFINSFGEQFFGYSKEEIIGKNIIGTLANEKDSSGKNLRKLVEKIAQDPLKFMYSEIENITKTGEKVWIYWTNKPVYDSKKNLIEILSIGTDITERKFFEKELELLASTDLLTGLYNRRKFEEILGKEIQEAKRYNKTFSIILLDIDFFKDINDTYGHQVGDYILQSLARLIKNMLRSTDSVARWGGEEFVIILPNGKIDGAYMLAERLRKTIENTKFPIERKCTISLGVTQYKPDDTPHSILKRADLALYTAKQNGRNKTVKYI